MFTVENLTASLNIFYEKIERQKDELSSLDAAIGDGDHGNNMSRGMTAVKQNIEGKEFNDVATIFQTVAISLISKVGGASGPLYGTAMMEMGKTSKNSSDILKILSAGLAGIKLRGKSDVGDKTMIDVWSPTIDSIKEGELDKGMLVEYLNNTKNLEAKKGRASYLGARSIGHLDPGAASSLLLFESFIEAGVFDE